MTSQKVTPKFISLYRVSTRYQGDSQLGLKAQKSAITNYIASVDGVLLNEHKEVESGVNKERFTYGQSINLDSLLYKRKGLLQAVEECRTTGAVLLVKEVTRLTRSPLVYEYLKATGVKFICTDYPNDDAMMLGLRIQFGAEEALQISKRTKAGLAKSEKQLGRMGAINIRKVDHQKRVGVLQQKAKTNKNNIKASGYVCTLIKAGKTLQQVADTLNKEGFLTARGKAFAPTTVQRLYERFC